MKEPLPQKPKSPPRKDAAPARSSSGGRVDVDMKIRYYCSMKPNRLYPLTVELQRGRDSAAGSASVPVVVRPVVPGAVVTPAEEKLDAAQPGAKAVFQVTPLAKGRLRDARVEVQQHGHSVDQARLGMKSRTQRPTKILLLLTLLVPWLMVLFTHHAYYPLKGNGRELGLREDPERARTPGEVLDHKLTTYATAFFPKIPELREYFYEPVIRALRVGYDWACHLADDYLPFWVGVLLFSITLLSWVACRAMRTSRRKSLSLSAAIPLAEAAETLPLTAREQAPRAPQPAE